MANNGESTNVELIIANALKMPGVKVNRKEFLVKYLHAKKSVSRAGIPAGKQICIQS